MTPGTMRRSGAPWMRGSGSPFICEISAAYPEQTHLPHDHGLVELGETQADAHAVVGHAETVSSALIAETRPFFLK